MKNNKLELEEMVKQFLNYLNGVARFSDRTVLAYRYDLSSLVRFMKNTGIKDVAEIQRSDIEAFLAHIPHSDTGSVANYNRRLSSLRSFFKFLIRHGLENNPTEEFLPTKNHVRQISYLNENERVNLMDTIKNQATPFYRNRDLAIISLFLTTGMRVSELTNLKINDIDFKNERDSYLVVRRKGGSEDRLPIPELVANRIKKYLQKRKVNSEEVFLSKRGESLKPNSVYYMVRKYLRKAGIQKKKMGPHILRHTVAVSLLKRKVDLMTISRLLGHRRLDTTAVYLHIEPQDIENAVNLISI